jgi:ABC-type transport system substrate-binding protein
MHYNFWIKCGSAVQWWVGVYCNPEIDELIDLGGETTDVAAKQEIQQQILEIIKEDSGIIWLYSSPDTYGYRTDLQGVEFNTRGDFIFENNKGIPWITRVATE